MHGKPNVYCDRAEIQALARLVIASDGFEETINFWMHDGAWDAYEEVQAATAEARDALIAAGYAHLLAGYVA